jgi:hypothetical protein
MIHLTVTCDHQKCPNAVLMGDAYEYLGSEFDGPILDIDDHLQRQGWMISVTGNHYCPVHRLPEQANFDLR